MELVHTIGRRKKAIARIYIKNGNGLIKIEQSSKNAKKKKNKLKILNYKDYFSHPTLIEKISRLFILIDSLNKYNITVKVKGGGLNGQVEAISLAISRGLCIINNDNRLILKPEGLLTRDSRRVERKKFGQKKARKKFQFSKR